MKRRFGTLLSTLALLALCLSASAYTAYPTLSAGASNSGLTGGSVIGYTVLGTDAVTVIVARSTSGIVEIGNGSYAVPAGVTVPDGSTYFVEWDRSDTSTILGAAPTQQSDTAGSIKARTLLALPGVAAGAAGGLPTATNSSGQVVASSVAAPVTLPANAPSTFLANDATVAALPSAADIASAVFGSSFLTIPADHTISGTQETLTWKQAQALADAVNGGDTTQTVPARSGTATVTYYLRGAAKTSGNIVAISTVTYDSAGNAVTRSVKVAQPFPSVN